MRCFSFQELSGLGPRKALQAQCLEERYTALKNAAQTRSVVALGLTCFSQSPSEENTFRVLVCDVTLLCSEPYMLDPCAATFLAQHGFSFNQQFCRGIPYKPPSLHAAVRETISMLHSSLTSFCLVRARRPLVVHNGLIDLAFAYHAFHAPLPPTLQAFMCDLVSLFPAGIYDTKLIAETTLSLSATYLAYAYRKWHDERGVKKLDVEFGNFPQALSSNIDFRFCSPPPLNGEQEGPEIPALCKRFANYGFCPESSCLLSHDTDRAISRDEAEAKGRRERQTRKKRHRAEGQAHVTPKMGNDLDFQVDKLEADVTKMQNDETSKGNPFVFAYALTISRKSSDKQEKCATSNAVATLPVSPGGTELLDEATPQNGSLPSATPPWLPDANNRLYVSGRQRSLRVEASAFQRPSKGHRARMATIGLPLAPSAKRAESSMPVKP
uniref:Target of EGR1, exonuclease n=1 Tax=Eptatretus burgeri TaxID=7764 RepID=A0A8C4PWF1_EPTBU